MASLKRARQKPNVGPPGVPQPSAAYKRKGKGVRTLQFSLKNKPVKQGQPPSFPLASALAGGAENICSERERGEKTLSASAAFFLPNHAEDAGSCKDSIMHNAKNHLQK